MANVTGAALPPNTPSPLELLSSIALSCAGLKASSLYHTGSARQCTTCATGVSSFCDAGVQRVRRALFNASDIFNLHAHPIIWTS